MPNVILSVERGNIPAPVSYQQEPGGYTMGEKSKQAKEPKKKPQKTLLEKRKEKREKADSKHEE